MTIAGRVCVSALVLCLCGTCSSGGKGSSAPVAPGQRVEKALQQLGEDVREDAPIVGELERALAVRLRDEEATVIVRQYLHLLEAATRHQRVEPDPAFLALVERLSDLPYFNEFAAALRTEGGAPSAALAGETGGLRSATAALTASPTCKSDCSLSALNGYATGLGLGIIGAFNNQFDLVANGIACTDQTAALYDCAASNNCGRADLGSLMASCFQVAGALATAGASPVVIGAVGITGAIVGSLAARNSVDAEVRACEQHQEANCCIAQIKCGSACCAQGFACLPSGVCARNATAGCEPDESPCGLYCCAAGDVCAPDGTCRRPAVCLGSEHPCGANCCPESQLCGLDGNCQECEPAALCGGTVCCKDGRFCNALGQCLPEPTGGCGAVCGASCCARGQDCSAGECLGQAVACDDGQCTAGMETPLACPADCASQCGDHTCQAWEVPSTCAGDCAPPPQSKPDAGVGANPYDGVWLLEFEMNSCDAPTPTPGLSGTVTVTNGTFGSGLLFTYQFMECTQQVTMTGGTVSERGRIDGFFTFSGNCCGPSEDNFYGSMSSPTSGWATSFWARVTLTKQ